MPQLILVQPKDTHVTSAPMDKMATLRIEIKELQNELESVRNDVQTFLEEKHKDNPEYLPTLRNAIAFLPASTRVEQIPLLGWKQQTEVSSAASFSAVFALLKHLCEFPDSSLLEHIVRLFGSDQLKSKMNAYQEQIQAFRAHTKVSDFAKTYPKESVLPPDFSILTVKLGREWHLSTLEDIEQLRLTMIQRASLTSYSTRLLQIEWDEGQLHWCVPSRALHYLVGMLDSEYLLENHVELLSINGTHLQSTQPAGMVVNPSSSSSSPPPSAPVPGGVLQSGSGQVLVPLPLSSGSVRQSSQSLSLMEQLAQAGTQVVQFKPAISLPMSDLRPHPSPTAAIPPTANATTAHNTHHTTYSVTHPTATVHIMHPQALPTSAASATAAGIHMPIGRPTPMPVVQHPGPQPIQIIHPQLLQPSNIAAGAGKVSSRIVLRMKTDAEAQKPNSSVESKLSFPNETFMVMQGSPSGDSLMFLPSYVMVKPGTQQKSSLSSPPSTISPSCILSPGSQEKKSTTVNYQGLANLLQPSTAAPLHASATSTTRLIPINNANASLSSSGTSIVTLNSVRVATSQSKPGESPLSIIPPVITLPNPSVVASSGARLSPSLPASTQELSIQMEMNPARTGTQAKSLNHICSVCGNGYMWASSLKRHMHTHLPGQRGRHNLHAANLHAANLHAASPPYPDTKKKDIECQVCHQMVESPAAYTRHLRLHMRTETSRAFFCRLCGIMFDTSSAYEQHIQTHMMVKEENRVDEEQEEESSDGDRASENGNRESGDHKMVEEERGDENGDNESGEETEEGEEKGGDGDNGEEEEKAFGEERKGENVVGNEEREGARDNAVKIETSSSSSEHSSNSASEEEAMETALAEEQTEPHLHSQTPDDGNPHSESASTSNDTTVLPSTPSEKLPFSQLLKLVGCKGEDTSTGESGGDAEPNPTSATTTATTTATTATARRFRCDECGRYLSSQAALSGHQLCMHNKQKPHVCHICQKGFFQSHSLTVHLRSHSGEKPYSCLVCKKSFSQRSSLNIHIRTHSGERPYQCPFCSRGFSDSSTLAKHRRTHTGERPYQCRECGASFSQSGNLWRHMKQVHPTATTA